MGEIVMRRMSVLLTACLLLGPRATLGQNQVVHAPDGGTQETIASITVPPLAGAPFSATVNTEWTRSFEGGGTVVLRNHRLIARDRVGRVFQERRSFATDGDQRPLRLTQSEIADPQTHTIAICDGSARVCDIRIYRGNAIVSLPPAGPLPNGSGFLTRDDLGRRIVNGFEAIGTREVQTTEPTPTGVDRAVSVTKEFWYSPQLGINLITKRSDPRGGMQLFTVTDINLADPDVALFSLPKAAQIVDRRARPR